MLKPEYVSAVSDLHSAATASSYFEWPFLYLGLMSYNLHYFSLLICSIFLFMNPEFLLAVPE